MTVYISGPAERSRNGLFAEAAEKLLASGHVPVTPADTAAEVENEFISRWPCAVPGYGDYLKAELMRMLDCSAVLMLPGWERSREARLERMIAEAVGIKIMNGQELNTPDR